MTDDVIREDAERLVRWSRCMVLGDNTFNSPMAVADAADVVATRLLELLPPADDGELVTAERVMKLGVTLVKNQSDYQFADLRTNWSVMGTVSGSHIDLSLMFREDGSLAGCDIESTVYGGDGRDDTTDADYTLPVPKTMGEFRLLCSALGIQLKESK